LPPTLFTSTQPTKFFTGIIINIEQNKSYIIILSNSSGIDEISVIEKNEVNKIVTSEKQGVFIQILNAVDDLKFNLGKNYILIFAGKHNIPNKITNIGFSVIVLQEF